MKALIYYLNECTLFVLSLCAVFHTNNLTTISGFLGRVNPNIWFCLCLPRRMEVKRIIEQTKAKVCLCFAPLEISMRALSALQWMISKRGAVMSRKEKYCWHAGNRVFFYRLGSFYVFEQETRNWGEKYEKAVCGHTCENYVDWDHSAYKECTSNMVISDSSYYHFKF